MKIGRLLAIERGPNQRRKRGVLKTWICRCDCGMIKSFLEQSLIVALRNKKGGSRSCGCWQRDKATKHGAMKGNVPTPEYAAWIAAKKRCYTPSNPSFKHYGERGISMCDEWINSFETFLAEMGPRPTDGKWYLDRIDNNKGYEPGNCRWTPLLDSNRNKHPVTIYEYNGQEYTIVPLSKIFGFSPNTLRRLINKGFYPNVKTIKRPSSPTTPPLDLSI